MKDAWRHFSAEFIGTFALVFIGGGTIITSPMLQVQAAVVNIAFAHGLILALLVTATMRISGHLNPAVTAGFLVTRRIEAMMAVVYWIAQFMGAIIAAYLLKALYPANIVAVTKLGGQFISSDITLVQAIALEAIATFFLVFAVFGTAVDDRGPWNKTAGLTIGLVIAFDIMAFGPWTGAAMNPARWFGPALATGEWTDWWVWIVGPIAGAIVAAVLYWTVFLRDKEPATP